MRSGEGARRPLAVAAGDFHGCPAQPFFSAIEASWQPCQHPPQ